MLTLSLSPAAFRPEKITPVILPSNMETVVNFEERGPLLLDRLDFVPGEVLKSVGQAEIVVAALFIEFDV